MEPTTISEGLNAACDLVDSTRRMFADIEAGVLQRRPLDWPSDEEVSAAAERAVENAHCAACRKAAS